MYHECIGMHGGDYPWDSPWLCMHDVRARVCVCVVLEFPAKNLNKISCQILL